MSKRTWTDIVPDWRRTLALERQGDWVELLDAEEERLLMGALNAVNTPDAIRSGPERAVDEALAEAAAYTRLDLGQTPAHVEFAAWCDNFRRGHAATSDALSAAAIKRSVALVAPPEVHKEPGLGVVTGQLLDALQDGDPDTAGAWGLYAAGLAALAVHHGWGPGAARAPEARPSWSTFAWLLASVAFVLLKRARSYKPSAPPPAA